MGVESTEVDLVPDPMLPADVTEYVTIVDGVRLHWVSIGEGEPVVFVHGFSSSLHSWDQNLGRIGRVRSIALDLPGHGESARPLATYTVTYYARMLQRFLEVSGIGPATVVGLSLGGLLAGRLALDFPDWVRRLVLVDAAGVGSKPQRWEARLRFLPMLFWQAIGLPSRRATRHFLLTATMANPAQVTDEFVELSILTQKQSRLASVLTGFTLLLPDARIYEQLPRIQAPTLVIWGERDATFPMADALAAAARISGAHVAVVPKVGHTPNIQSPKEFNAVLRDFLTRKE